MTHRYALLISPEARSAYFHQALEVAQRELLAVFGPRPVQLRQVGGMDFIEIEADGLDLRALARLSCVQGVFDIGPGEALVPLAADPGFALHPDFVFGSKFKGKTNERLTQMLINLGLAALGPREHVTLLDPMCGRATSLLWAMRYGIEAFGVERDPAAFGDLQRMLKKWCKLHRVKHKMSEGFTRKKSKSGIGRFLEFRSGGTGLKLVTGDARDLVSCFGQRRFDLMVSDLPYGVQHGTEGGTRNPLEVLSDCAPVWREHLAPEGAVVLAFNANNPRRAALETAFEQAGFQVEGFAAPHRMSESILRDVLILRHR